MDSVLTVGETILRIADRQGKDVTPLELVKLCYISEGWSLALENKSLFDEKIEAWDYGPVIPRIYHEIKFYGRSPIPCGVIEKNTKIEEETSDFIKTVYDEYKDFSGIELSMITHDEGTPWHKVYKKGVSYIPIERKLIKEHYLGLLKKRSKDG